jgi:hypothetical protein
MRSRRFIFILAAEELVKLEVVYLGKVAGFFEQHERAICVNCN